MGVDGSTVGLRLRPDALCCHAHGDGTGGCSWCGERVRVAAEVLAVVAAVLAAVPAEVLAAAAAVPVEMFAVATPVLSDVLAATAAVPAEVLTADRKSVV